MVTSALVGTTMEPPRVAYSVGRRVAGGAVSRNRVRRRLRAAVRECAPELEVGHAYLVSAVGPAASAPYGQVLEALRACLCALRDSDGRR